MENKITHVIYSDESNLGSNYKSICALSMAIDTSLKLEKELTSILQESDVREFKWKKLRSAKYRFCAIKMMEKIIEMAVQYLLRIDTLIWTPTKVPNEDKNLIFQKMYYKLFKNIIHERWPKNIFWKIYPDQQSIIEWDKIKGYLDSSGFKTKIKKENDNLYFEIARDFNIVSIEEINSRGVALSQISDLFGGMAAFSHTEYTKIRLRNGQVKLSGEIIKHTAGIREKIHVLEEFNRKCKENKLGVSLKTKKGLWTPNPKNPINFWMFKHPQLGLGSKDSGGLKNK